MANRKWRVTFKVGNPDHGVVETRTAETFAATARKAVSNIWYRQSREETFYLVSVEVI